MLTKITIQNFKKLEHISFDLVQSVVLIGPNNAGKTTVFQALCLWELGVRSYLSAQQQNDLNRYGSTTINRRDLINSPIQDARFLWLAKKVTKTSKGKPGATHIPLIIKLEGESNGENWVCKTEFVFSNAESITCKITEGLDAIKNIYNEGEDLHFGFLQAMSGLASTEDKLTQGSVDTRLGEGRTAEVLRNICYDILYPEIPRNKNYDGEVQWGKLVKNLQTLFGISLQKPEFIPSRGLIDLKYKENDILFDVSAAGRGLQQTLLLLAYMYAHPKNILLLDEPDAHLEIIRQRQIFSLLNDVAAEVGSQIIIASHSEVVLNEAAKQSKIIAIIENRVIELNKSENAKQFDYFKKSLTTIGWDKYYLARQKGHVFYLEGDTDLKMLEMFAQKLNHPVYELLGLANVVELRTNVPNEAIKQFSALQTVFPDLKGLVLFDRLENVNYPGKKLPILQWKRRELENYFAAPDVLLRWVEKTTDTERITEYKNIMNDTISDFTRPIYLRNLHDNWWNDAKLTDDWLDLIIPEFLTRVRKIEKIPEFRKHSYYKFINLLKKDEIDPEITEKLDAIYALLQ